MDVDAMLLDLSVRLEDPDETLFDDPKRLEALNDAQSRLINLLNREHLTEITEIALTKTAANGTYSLLVLSDLYGSGGSISMVRYNSSGVYFTPISLSAIKKLEMTNFAPSITAPYFFVYRSKIYTLAGVTSPVIDIFYLRKPTGLVATGECDLNPKLHEILVNIAAGISWGMNEKLDRAQAALDEAYAGIKTINDKGV